MSDDTLPPRKTPDSSEASLIKSSALMASGTVVSRITGVGRDVAMTAALGFFIVADAYSLGNTLPNIVYILVVGGALNAVFIPQLVRHMRDDLDSGAAYTDRLLTLIVSALLLLSVIAVIAAPWIVSLYATSEYSDSQRALAVAFAQFCLPQILFYGVYTVFSQVLVARGHFGAAMFAPIINNVIAIGVFVCFLAVAGSSAAADGALSSTEVAWLGIGSTVGVAAQALILVPVLWRSGYVLRPRFDWRGTGLRKTGSLAAWTIGLVLVNQLGYIVITRLATFANVIAENNALIPAGLTTYQKAHLIFILPHSVITVSLVTALLPRLSRSAHEGNLRSMSQRGSGSPARGDYARARPTPDPAHLRVRGIHERLGHLHGRGGHCLSHRHDSLHALLHPPSRLVRARGHSHPLLPHHRVQRDDARDHGARLLRRP